MNKEEIISIVKKYVKNECYDDSTGHDWCHIQRVYNNAMLINKKENADEFIITIIVTHSGRYNKEDKKYYSRDQRQIQRIYFFSIHEFPP